jgi:hypothetical protein
MARIKALWWWAPFPVAFLLDFVGLGFPRGSSQQKIVLQQYRKEAGLVAPVCEVEGTTVLTSQGHVSIFCGRREKGKDIHPL